MNAPFCTSRFSNEKIVLFTVFFITVAALFIRIKYVEQTEIDTPIRADAAQYVIYGYNLYSKGIFSKEFSSQPQPDSYRSPGYPFLIYLGFMTGGKRGFYSVVIYTQIILSTLLVPLTFLVGIRFLASIWTTFASLLVAFSPHLISMTSYLLTETLFSFLLLFSIYLFYIALEKEHVFYFILSGILFGCTCLTNETALFIPFLTAIASIYYHIKQIYPKRKMILNMFVYLVVFLLFPIGWTLRSHSLSSESSKGSSRAIATMSHGAYPDFIYKNKKFKYFPYMEDPMQPRFGSTFENFSKILFERFKERPLRYLSWYFFEKPYYIWSWNILQGQGDIYVYPVKTSLYKNNSTVDLSRRFIKLLHPFILAAALIGIASFIRRKENKYIFIPFLVIVYYTLLYTVFAPWPRYSVPLRPELYLFAIWTCSILLQKFRNKKT